jgi:hypothetical protein
MVFALLNDAVSVCVIHRAIGRSDTVKGEWICKKTNIAYFNSFFGRRKGKRKKSHRFFCFRFVISLLAKSEILQK